MTFHLRKTLGVCLAAVILTASSASPLFAQEADEPAFLTNRINALVLIVVFCAAVLYFTYEARKGKRLFLRKIAGLDAVEEAVGRATEMGRPVLYIPGILDLDEMDTIAGVSILGRVTKIIAEYETPLIVPARYPTVLAACQEICEQSYVEAGKPDGFNKDSVRYLAGEQFAFTAAVNGIMMRERPATNIFLGGFFAESLLLAETGNAAGSIQIAGTSQPEQLPFFIAACDYTLMGEELYAASAYLSHEPLMTGGLKGQDLLKVAFIAVIVIGVVLSLLDHWDVIDFFDIYSAWFQEA